MRKLVESLKRFYLSNRLTLEDIEERKTKGTINEEEFNYIVN